MTELKQQEETLFEAARNLADPAARQGFLERGCHGNARLRARVEALLAADAQSRGFFDSAAPLKAGVSLGAVWESAGAETGAAQIGGPPSPLLEGPGSCIGRYKLVQKIGEGGCGVVYMAEQSEPLRRQVALKIIKLGMDTKSVIARFETERQALALMDHPNIARVLDAGATDLGRPYFVMELVRGIKITDYCDQNRLDTRRRLELFVQICHAIQHAHQKGIIHRDIKPSNILVTINDGQPIPKVIDFGIAKATGGWPRDQTSFTGREQFIGTPAYMSPEQSEMGGLDIDTRSDIYSLGVLLYELLAGRTPFDGKQLLQSGLVEMRRTLLEKEPQRPSALLAALPRGDLRAMAVMRQTEPARMISSLKGDLDWIVMRALEKDRGRRYETANGFAMDIERHLSHEPVVARPPSRLYRFGKLVRRNQGVFAAVGAVAAALLFGLETSTWLFFQERVARQRAVAAEQQQTRLRAEAEAARNSEAKLRQEAVAARNEEARLRREAEAREKVTQAAVLINQSRFEEADEILNNVELPLVKSLGSSRIGASGAPRWRSTSVPTPNGPSSAPSSTPRPGHTILNQPTSRTNSASPQPRIIPPL